MTREELDFLVNHGGKDGKIFYTHSGTQISLKEYAFINSFLREGDFVVAVKESGFKPSRGIEDEAHYKSTGKNLLSKPYIYEELCYRIEEMNKMAVADAGEILEYFTRVMRGEEKDQFNLDAPLSERTAAAKELAKRIIDIPNKASEADRAIKIELDWKRPDAERSAELPDSNTEN